MPEYENPPHPRIAKISPRLGMLRTRHLVVIAVLTALTAYCAVESVVRANIWITERGALACVREELPDAIRVETITRHVFAPAEVSVVDRAGATWWFDLDTDITFTAQCDTNTIFVGASPSDAAPQ